MAIPSFLLCGIHTDDKVSHNSPRCRALEATAIDPSHLSFFGIWRARELLSQPAGGRLPSDPPSLGMGFSSQHCQTPGLLCFASLAAQQLPRPATLPCFERSHSVHLKPVQTKQSCILCVRGVCLCPSPADAARCSSAHPLPSSLPGEGEGGSEERQLLLVLLSLFSPTALDGAGKCSQL